MIVAINMIYARYCNFFQLRPHILTIEKIFDVSVNGIATNKATNHQAIKLSIVQIFGFNNKVNGALVSIKYQVECAIAKHQIIIHNSFLWETITFKNLIFGNKSLAGLENIIIINR